MITLYTWNTPNGQKPAILLEELGLDYEIVPIDIRSGAQKSLEYLTLNPNGKIPSLTDDKMHLFESGAILIYLAEKHRSFLAPEGQARVDAIGWSLLQVGGLGPMLGQFGHFAMAEEKNPPAIERYLAECLRLFGVYEARLRTTPYLAGEDYSIADMMNYPWLKIALGFVASSAGDRMPETTATKAWLETVGARPAVTIAMAKIAALSA